MLLSFGAIKKSEDEDREAPAQHREQVIVWNEVAEDKSSETIAHRDVDTTEERVLP